MLLSAVIFIVIWIGNIELLLQSLMRQIIGDGVLIFPARFFFLGILKWIYQSSGFCFCFCLCLCLCSSLLLYFGCGKTEFPSSLFRLKSVHPHPAPGHPPFKLRIRSRNQRGSCFFIFDNSKKKTKKTNKTRQKKKRKKNPHPLSPSCVCLSPTLDVAVAVTTVAQRRHPPYLVSSPHQGTLCPLPLSNFEPSLIHLCLSGVKRSRRSGGKKRGKHTSFVLVFEPPALLFFFSFSFSSSFFVVVVVVVVVAAAAAVFFCVCVFPILYFFFSGVSLLFSGCCWSRCEFTTESWVHAVWAFIMIFLAVPLGSRWKLVAGSPTWLVVMG